MLVQLTLLSITGLSCDLWATALPKYCSSSVNFALPPPPPHRVPMIKVHGFGIQTVPWPGCHCASSRPLLPFRAVGQLMQVFHWKTVLWMIRGRRRPTRLPGGCVGGVGGGCWCGCGGCGCVGVGVDVGIVGGCVSRPHLLSDLGMKLYVYMHVCSCVYACVCMHV